MTLQKVSLPFELKDLAESGERGTFTGIASMFGVLDLVGDVVDRGAFAKSLSERGRRVPLLEGHRTRIGIATVSETSSGLRMLGEINLDKQVGRDTYSDLRFYDAKELPLGLSVGFITIKDRVDGGIRHIVEAKLMEISTTEFPACEPARVQQVKSAAEVTDSAASRLIDQIKCELVIANIRAMLRR